MPHTSLKKEKLFGTDGIRGTPGEHPLTDDMIRRIGSGIARFVVTEAPRKRKPAVVIGKDTRLSGGHIESTLSHAITAGGVDVIQVGIITTPGLSFLTRHFKAQMGIMISASHNKASDNGIKFFTGTGYKLSAKEEDLIETIIFDSITHDTSRARAKRSGNIRALRNAQNIYVKFLASTLHGLDLKGVTVAVDCAWGAAAPFARRVFTALGARVHSIHDKPSGETINEGGAIHPEALKKLVVAKKADIGIAVDGDGDRGILIDETGRALDGDSTLAIVGKYLIQRKKLPRNTIVGTVMSNIGLKICIEGIGGTLLTTNVGDKYVLETLLQNNLILGGEQSGHIIFLDYLSTPDGLLTALQVLKVMRDSSAKLSELAGFMTKYPQILVNVKVRERKPFESMPAVSDQLNRCNERLQNNGRILLRYSGTELLARVMVEGKDKDSISEIANSLAQEIKNEIGI